MSDYLSNYLSRINASGKNVAESQFNTTANFINDHFTESPFYRVVKLNGMDFEVQLQDIQIITRSASVALVENLLKFMLLKPNTSANVGDMVEFDDTFWLVTDSVSNNPLFPKVKIEKCNYTLSVKTGETKTLMGHDSLNRPDYKTTPTLVDVQCLLRNTASNISLNQEINLPVGLAYITVPYNDTTKIINENDNFDLYGKQFKVVGFDYTNIVNGIGCLIIVAERVVNT